LIGPPLVALFSASRIGLGNVVKPVFGRVVADGLFTVTDNGGSFELQLDTPNAARSPSEITVHATRSGVQNFSLFLSDIVSTTLLSAQPLCPLRLCGDCATINRRGAEDTEAAQRRLLLFAKPERIQNHRHLSL